MRWLRSKTGLCVAAVAALAGAGAGAGSTVWPWLSGMDAKASATHPEPLADVHWERRWLTPLDPNICTPDPVKTSKRMAANAEGAFSISGGSVRLQVQPQQQRVQGQWVLEDVQAPWGWLHASLPEGFALHAATAGNASVMADVRDGHMAIALDAFARQACTVTLDFEVALSAAMQPATGRIGTDGIWLSAGDVLPRLGLDGDRLLRNPAIRKTEGVSDFLTMPDYHASPAVAGVAPAGHWRWHVQAEGGLPLHGASGSTDGALDFGVAWAPGLHTETIAAGLEVLGAQQQGAGTALAADLQAMQSCTAQRMGGTANVSRIALLPPGMADDGLAGYPQSRLSAGILWLPQELAQAPAAPSTEQIIERSAEQRAARRASMAQAIALRHVADTAQLRQGKGAQWIAEGLPAALALLCVAETAEPGVMQQLLQRAAKQADSALQARHEEVGAVAYAAFDGWVRQYAPLAALDTVRRLSASQIDTLLRELRDGVRVQYALANALGVARTTLALSMPLATDLRMGADGTVTGERWRWQQGQWVRQATPRESWALAASAETGLSLHLDAWPGYERQAADNVLKP